ncbi:MAG: hypothetical protein DDT34_01932 [Firmicutes bacterium]|nr:hypothetical protein [Bacillota bacterium]
MKRHNILYHLLVGNFCHFHNCCARCTYPTVQIVCPFVPICFGGLFYVKSVTDEVERNVIWQANRRWNKPVTDRFPCILVFYIRFSRIVRDWDKIERLVIHQLTEFLERIHFIATTSVEIVSELIPHENYFDIVLVNDIR